MIFRAAYWQVLGFLTSLIAKTVSYDPQSRWGQATVLVNDALFVFGGKVDEFNSFSYTSAPNTNDILYLPLSSGFATDSPPWALVSGSSNSSTSQGPALAWATLSALNSGQVLVFGGQPDSNSDIVLVGGSDSALILDVWNRLGPEWRNDTLENQPLRRIHHSTVTTPSGLVFIFGGERADGSGTCRSDNWAFDPATLTFTEIMSTNGPPALCAPMSILLPNGRILVFGGADLTTIYVLDMSRTWGRLPVAPDPFPSARRAFAAVLIGTNRILIHGGSDESLQNNMDDGWILDLSQTPATWTRLDALSELGARRDHFAVALGNQVVFGFGYGPSSPAPSKLEVFDVDGGTFAPSHTPVPTSVSRTLPLTAPSSSPTSKSIQTGTGGSDTASPRPTQTAGHDDNSQSTGKKKVTTIAVSTTISVLALIIIVVGGFYYRRHRQRRFLDERHFIPVSGGDDDSQKGRHIPRVAGFHDKKFGSFAGIIRGATVKSRNPREILERRNMLDDEDNHNFGAWYEDRRQEGTNGSTWSLMSIFGRKSRDASLGGQSTTSSTPWREKADPFSDTPDEEFGASSRPKNRREASYVSARSGLSYNSYTDPFQDPIMEERRTASDASFDAVRLVTARPPPLASLRTNLPLEHVGHALSPLSERTSNSTLPRYNSASSSSLDNVSQFSAVGSSATSYTHGPSRSPKVSGGSLPAVTEVSIGRRDSWWSRLARRTSDASYTPRTTMRDPNPLTRLVTIDESVHSHSPENESPPFKRSSPGVPPPTTTPHQKEPYFGKHGKSMSSLRTADSEAIERIGGVMEVVQRGKRRSTDSTSDLSIGTDISGNGDLARFSSPTETGPSNSWTSKAISRAHSLPPTSAGPPPISLYNSPPTSAAATGGAGLDRSIPLSPSGNVAARIQAFERRQSEDHEPTSPTRANKRTSMDYGLVPRRSLFVANPDHRLSRSSASSS